ncbi:hypothetical protein L596_001652 [Steinernema carpocapsae]|uniref:BTB domain-containing protein n=1 Tax=Steinernema carpocapsae TaxID=34508 RepID=A0A4U8UMV2_STECR|nr:hypothetical protein L596_001652 [Steinernema carpocapsae]
MAFSRSADSIEELLKLGDFCCCDKALHNCENYLLTAANDAPLLKKIHVDDRYDLHAALTSAITKASSDDLLTVDMNGLSAFAINFMVQKACMVRKQFFFSFS